MDGVWAQLGATDCINPKDYPDKKIQDVIVGMSPTGFGIDNTFEVNDRHLWMCWSDMPP